MKNEYISMIKLGFDFGDSWGSAMSHWFDIATELDIRGERIPASWGYRAGAMGPHHDDEYTADALSHYDAHTLEQAGDILHRYTTWLRSHGKDY